MAERFPHNMTAANLPSPYVASASTENSGLEAFHAFDNAASFGQYWVATTSTGWLKIDLGLGNAYQAGSYRVRVNQVPEPNRAPKDWTFEGSNNNSTWTVVDTVVSQTGWISGETRVFICDVQTTSYRYFRLNITANNGDALVQVAELSMDDTPIVQLSPGFIMFF